MITIKRLLIILLVVIVGGLIYLFPKMLNQRSYDDYYLFEPAFSKATTPVPLILYLHGSGERGVAADKLAGENIPTYARQNDTFPFMVAAPVCDAGDSWHPMYLIRFLDTLIANYPIDTNRIYLTGLSMGGTAVWDLALYAPDRFAALAPVCGRFNHPLDRLETLTETPVWAFHGKKDEVVPFEPVEAAIQSLQAGQAEARLTLFPDLGHVIWNESYDNPQLYEWFMAQSR